MGPEIVPPGLRLSLEIFCLTYINLSSKSREQNPFAEICGQKTLGVPLS